ncbi:N-acetyl-gamma-glutamyl-phosphate reductase [Paenibacillus thermotolerans]|uniref:N-acetyl-gamma-glutamyl-phosphate reductase n=1 Tax=Paenibacillus thermotolerans TaxID=3027807 RepID=UPI002368868C|nr:MULTISPECIES: N-acetyl-gamma-glutamyl-phosphate reductase [unclassified Paenibacillus]
MKPIRVAIVGSTGYGGVELIRFLLQHPNVEITSIVSSSNAGEEFTDAYPHLQGLLPVTTLDAVEPELLAKKADVVFAATPSGVSGKLVPSLLKAGLKVIDLSGDFRLQSREEYERWYKHEAPEEATLKTAVYGLAEVYGDKVRGAQLISNPGCYATTALLGLIPAVEAGAIDPATIIIDAKSGVSGAGRGLSLNVHYSEINENFKAYKVNRHQHIPEIESVLADRAGRAMTTTFTTHLTPMTRGIMCTMYASVSGDQYRTEDAWISMYRQYYEGRRFVRIRDKGKWPATKEVWGSNNCDIGFAYDERTGRITIISVSDNLVKGAAGQAIQNLNLSYGWDEGLGLSAAPVYP